MCILQQNHPHTMLVKVLILGLDLKQASERMDRFPVQQNLFSPKKISI